MKQVDMPKRKPEARWLTANLGYEIAEDNVLTDEIAVMIERAQQSPAWPWIVDGFMFLGRAGIDRSDPAVVRAVIAQAERAYAGRTPPPPKKYPHEPIVYYFGLGHLVKIGTTQNIVERIGSINPQSVLAIERGSFFEESERHRFFASLRVHGEWFDHRDPLAAYIARVADEFERDFGEPLETWLTRWNVRRTA